MTVIHDDSADSQVTRRRFLKTSGLAMGATAAGGLARWPIALAAGPSPRLRAGAAQIDISPTNFPAIIAGGFLEKIGKSLIEPLYARALVLDDGSTRLCILVMDTLFIPSDVADEVKQSVSRDTGLSPDHILIAATHTHSAPSWEGRTLGTGVDAPFRARTPALLATVIGQAVANLQPARVGWTSVDDRKHTNCRRWICRPDRMGMDPFGEKTVRAMMHPGYQNPDYIGPAGPVDTGFSLLSVQTVEGRPLAVMANYSMHYFGAPAVHPDYYGLFCRELAQRIKATDGPAPVVIMSQGTSGDLHWMDYSQPRRTDINLEKYSQEMCDVAQSAYQTIRYQASAPLAMAEAKLTLNRRVPDAKRLAWAKEIIDKMGQREKPKDRPEVYAWQQVYLLDEPKRELKLQAVRIGELGITAIPCEVFGITGLKLKAQSPLATTFNMELANGCEGYIPPPEQHKLGGYTTWPARTAGLEVEAEPKIVATVLELLEKVSGHPRRRPAEVGGAYVDAVLAAKPVAYWRMHELTGPTARDSSGAGRDARCEDPVAYYLEGPQVPGLGAPAAVSRAVYLAGGCVRAELPNLGPSRSLEMWFWNGLPTDARPVTGCLFSLVANGVAGGRLTLGGSQANPGRLCYAGSDSAAPVVGRTQIAVRSWNHLVVVRDGGQVFAYLNGDKTPDLHGTAPAGTAKAELLLGRDSAGNAPWEGKLAEVAIYDRALGAEEIGRHYAAAAEPIKPA